MKYFMSLIILIILLSGCDGGISSVQDGDNQDSITTQTPEHENEVIQNQENTEVMEEKNTLIGTWHAWHMISSQCDERYHFYDDGTYLFEYSNYDDKKRVISESGVWDDSNDILKLIISSKVTIEGGEESTEPLLVGDPDEYAIINGTIRIVEMDPFETEEHRIELYPPEELDDATFEKDKESEYSYGYWTMFIDGVKYWKLTDNPDMYLNHIVLEDGDIWNPWP